MLESCSHFYSKDGAIVPVTPKFKENVKAITSQLASKSLRTLIIAYKHFPEDHPMVQRQLITLKSSKSSKRDSDRKENPIFNENPKELVLIALVGIKDPLRDGIKEAVASCQRAGVTVRMLTGDNKETAMAIAKEAGIIQRGIDLTNNPYVAMEGREFREFVGGLANEGTEEETVGNIENFKIVDQNLKVMARCSPSDKYLMAVGLKQLDHVVAMTGDGTNDAPALKKADIGLAMGIAGTEVAKEASGIILLDDNFKR